MQGAVQLSQGPQRQAKQGAMSTLTGFIMLDKTGGGETLVGLITLNNAGAGGGDPLAGFAMSWGASTVRGWRARLAKWWSTAAMVAAVIISIVRPIEGGVLALITDSQEGGTSGIRTRRRAMRGENSGESQSSRSEAWYI